MKRKMAVVVLLGLLCGCGSVNWFPDDRDQAPATSADAATVKEVGKFLGSTRLEGGDFLTRAEKGVFETYTSLAVPIGSRVVYEVHQDKGTGLSLGQILRSQDRAVLVKKTLALD